jgi:predicted phage-related endonuclease
MTGTRYVAAEHDGRQYHTTAVPLVAHDSSDASWLDVRRQGIGASEIGSVAGVPGAFSSPFALWWAKRLGWETEQSFAMKVGHKLEPVIGELFAEEYPGVTLVRPSWRLYRHPQHAWMLASPDFIAVEPCGVCNGTGRYASINLHEGGTRSGTMTVCRRCDGEGGWIEPVECKSDEGRDWKGDPPPKHLMQLWQQMLVFGAARGHLVRLSGKRLSAYVVDPDTSGTETILTAGAWFAGCLKTGTPPAVDGHPATEEALQRLYPPGDYPETDPHASRQLADDLIAEFKAAYEDRRRANARFDAARNAIRAAMTDARFGVDANGDRVVVHRKYKRTEFVMPACEVDEIRKAW